MGPSGWARYGLDAGRSLRSDKFQNSSPHSERSRHPVEDPPMRALDRRHFFQDTAALAAGLATIPSISTRGDENDKEADVKPAGPNETLRVAVCGVRGRGMEHIQGWGNLKKDARITTICDIDLNVTGPANKAVARRWGSEPKVVQDIHRVLEDPA